VSQVARALEGIQRVFVALNSSPSSLAAAEQAADLAARWSAELVGLFVEDPRLLGVTEHALGKEVGLYSGRTRALDSRAVERRYRAEAARIRAAIGRSAARARVRWSFRVGRGTVAGELLRMAHDSDLAVVGRSGWSSGASRLGPVARQILVTGPRHTLLVRPGVPLPLPLVLVYDGSPAARRATELSRRFRSSDDQEVVVLVPGGEKERKRLDPEIASAFDWLAAAPRVVTAKSAGTADLLRSARRVGCGFLVLPGGSDSLSRETLLEVSEAIESPVLVVR
jgi:hypothetical protein